MRALTTLRFSRCCRSANGATCLRESPTALHRAPHENPSPRRFPETRRRCRRRRANRAAGHLRSRPAARGCHPTSIPRASPPAAAPAMSAVLQWMRQHRRTKHRCLRRIRPRRALLQPREQRQIGRRQAVPHLLHLVGLDAADLRQRDLRQPRRCADAQTAGDQLEQRQPHRGIAMHPASPRRSPAVPPSAQLSSASTTSARRGGAALVGAAGHISATVSARSPT